MPVGNYYYIFFYFAQFDFQNLVDQENYYKNLEAVGLFVNILIVRKEIVYGFQII